MNNINFSLLCPLTPKECEYLHEYSKDKQVDIYCGKDVYIITFLGQRKYKYTQRNILKSILAKIDYTVKNNI